MYNKCQPTLQNHYMNGDLEYVFCVKSRPFACLVSPHLPTPSTSLIDYELVSKLGLKMSDLKCQRFFFGGQKMRILGKVSLTVQTIQDGLSSGNFHIKANVVTDLTKNFDTDCVAGSKTRNQLNQSRCPQVTPPPARTSAPPSPARTSAPPSPAKTPATTPPSARTLTTTTSLPHLNILRVQSHYQLHYRLT